MPSSAISSRISHVLRSFWPTGLTLLLVLWLTLAPDPLPKDTPELFPGVDKLVHAVMMGGITGAIIFDIKRTTARQKTIPVRTIVIVCLAVAAFSFADEVAQSLMGLGQLAFSRAARTSALRSSSCLSRESIVPSGPKRIMQGMPEIP